jgi:hypothetical protein
MRIRSIKPEFWRSEDIASLDIPTRLLFVGLWSYVDDNGVGDARVSSIAADLFASDLSADPAQTLIRVSDGLDRLSEKGMICRYTADGKSLLFVTAWEAHQLVRQPSKGHCYPLPSADSLSPASGVITPSADSAQTLRTGAGEQGNRGEGAGEQRSSDPLSPDESDDAHRIPADWRPNQTHVDKAASLHLDVKSEYQRFREHAERKHRRLKNWNAGFTNWLRKQAEYRQERQGSRPSTPSTYDQGAEVHDILLARQQKAINA